MSIFTLNLIFMLPGKDTALTWARRVRILRDCALALRFLHHYIDGCIVHRDIKVNKIGSYTYIFNTLLRRDFNYAFSFN